jgi:hypothetical protein
MKIRTWMKSRSTSSLFEAPSRRRSEDRPKRRWRQGRGEEESVSSKRFFHLHGNPRIGPAKILHLVMLLSLLLAGQIAAVILAVGQVF